MTARGILQAISATGTPTSTTSRVSETGAAPGSALYALLTDLADRGLDKDVVVVACGEMGRSPRVGKPNSGGNASSTGRDHWETGFAWIAGGGLRTGQVVGATDRYGEKPKGQGYTAQNLLATLYQVLGIDTTQTFPDHAGRPQYLLDDREPITELL